MVWKMSLDLIYDVQAVLILNVHSPIIARQRYPVLLFSQTADGGEREKWGTVENRSMVAPTEPEHPHVYGQFCGQSIRVMVGMSGTSGQ